MNSDTRPRRMPRPRPQLTLTELRRMVADDNAATKIRFDIPLDPVKFRAARAATFLTQEEFGRLAGISRPTVAALEAGGRHPSVAMWRKLCRALKCDPADLVPDPVKPPARRGSTKPPPVAEVPFSDAKTRSA